MEKYFLKPFIVLFFLFMSFVAHSKTVEFELKPLPTAKSGPQEIKKGLLDLYQGKISAEELEKQLLLAEAFQNQIYTLLEKKIAENKMIKAEVSERTVKGNFVTETVIQFPSLIQRPGAHPANQVIAKLYTPSISQPFCDYKYPTTIFLHHILDELPMIEDLGKVMASGVTHQPGMIAVIHMPHYGERKLKGEDFINPDMTKYRENIAQLILDTHMLRDFLISRSNVNPQKFSLTGMSLGGILGVVVGAFDQGFTAYGNLVGGVDTADILFNRATTRPDSEVAMALKGVKMDEDFIRENIAAADGMTWLHRYQNKKIFALNASRDDIVSYNTSVKPMIQILKANGNQLTEHITNDTHKPTGSIFKKIKTIFNPLMDFVVDDSPTYKEICPDRS